MVFLDYPKAFDTLEVWAVSEALKNGQVDSCYSEERIKQIFNNAILQIQLNSNNTKWVNIKRGGKIKYVAKSN